jgi:hypothetical protein
MLDVHPPHQSAHTWSDFFIHIATICIGLLIAIGLEQTVEAIHHTHQRTELREALRDDTATSIENAEHEEHFHTTMDHWLNGRIDQVDDALNTHHRIADPLPLEDSDFDAPDDPAWRAARSSGFVELLSQQDIKAYSEVDSLTAYAETKHEEMNDKSAPLREFRERFVHHNLTSADLSHATPEDLQQYRALLITYRDGIDVYSHWCHDIHGAEVAILHGERDLNRIEKAER